MIKRFFSSRREPRARVKVPDGRRIYAIGDIHGRLDLLDDLLARIDTDDESRGKAETTLIFLGDLVDRGPDSAGVVGRLRQLSESRSRTRFLLGNHEEIFLLAIAGDDRATELFRRIGGRETALSYGISPEYCDGLTAAEVSERLQALVPSAHRDFLNGFEDLIVIGDYAFAHAGVRPGVPLNSQRPEDLRWIRELFLDHHGTLEKVIVHGHSIRAEVEITNHRIGIDTGAYLTGRLSALGLEGAERWVLQT